MMYLTEKQIAAIRLLATYKYLTSSQFVKMGMYKKRGYLTNSLKALVDIKKPLLAKHDFNPISGKLESFYYLTRRGKIFLIDELDYCENQIKAPRGLSPVYLKDYYHRKRTIDFHIYLQQWLETNEGRVEFFNYYFDKSGNNRDGNTSKHVSALSKIQLDEINSFIPDASTIFSLGGQKHLCLFEQHNGKDAKRLIEQLKIHMLAISKGILIKKYSPRIIHKVAVVCEFGSVKNAVIQSTGKAKNINHYSSYFVFKSNAELEKDFYSNWTALDGKVVNFL